VKSTLSAAAPASLGTSVELEAEVDERTLRAEPWGEAEGGGTSGRSPVPLREELLAWRDVRRDPSAW